MPFCVASTPCWLAACRSTLLVPVADTQISFNAGNAASYATDLAADLRAMPPGSTVLVVGHSNTVPGIVEALSGQAAEAMPETEYDRYTLVLLDTDGGARVITSRY